MPDGQSQRDKINKLANEFKADFEPLEDPKSSLLTDERTGAMYCECHLKASNLLDSSTIDVPLDPDFQSEYRANRQILLDDPAFLKMKDDAKQGRSFSNIVAEYTKEFDAPHPLKVIGGQHRYEAIREALEAGKDNIHGLKVYFGLNKAQRLDVQLISNTNITIAKGLYDRLQETFKGPQLRDWCQKVGLLPIGRDFGDTYRRGGPISVQLARTFISNFYLGASVDWRKFKDTDTTPKVCATGKHDPEWTEVETKHPDFAGDKDLARAATAFGKLVVAQRSAFDSKGRADFRDKAMAPAVLAAWAYVAGILHKNDTRLKRHFALANNAKGDPLNAAALAKARHKSDPESYRGLGYRSDAKERGRLVELFYEQADSGNGVTKNNINVAMLSHFAKQSRLEELKARRKEQ